MPMALKKDVHNARRSSGNAKPLDLVHLGNQTMGDEALEGEILSMFASQSEIYMKMILNSCDTPTRIRAAHSLKGASRSIGAFELAELAACAEKYDHDVHDALREELDRVLAYIRSLH